MKPRSAALLLSLTLPLAATLLGASPARCQIKDGEFPPLFKTPFVKIVPPVPAKGDVKGHNARAKWLQEMGRTRAALAEYVAAIAIQPVSVETMWALIQRGDIYRERKEWDKATADYNRASDVGDAIWKDVDHKRAVRRSFEWRAISFEIGIAMNRVLMGRARVLLLTGHPQASLDVLNKLMPFLRPARSLAFGSPPFGETYVEPLDLWPALNGEVVRGTALIELRRYREALVDLNEGLHHEPRVIDNSPARYAELYFNRGRAYNGLGQRDKALADFNIAVKLDSAYKAPLKHTSYFKKLTPRDPGKDDTPADLSKTAAASVLRGEEERAFDLRGSDAVDFYNDAIASDAAFAPAYEGRAQAYAAVANGNTDSKQYQSDIYEAGAQARAQENKTRAKAYAALTQAERDAQENERLAKMDAEREASRNGTVAQMPVAPAKPKSVPLPAEKKAEYNAKAWADFHQAVALEPDEPRWLESLIAFEKVTPAYSANVAADERRLATLNKSRAAFARLPRLDGGDEPEIILPLWKVKP